MAFEKYLADCGLQVATDRDFGITALRWAGMKAGIGIIRKNNFFYTEKGSYQILSDRIIGSAVHDVQKHLRFLADNMGWLGSKDGTAAEQIRKMDLRLRCLLGCMAP